MNNNQDSMRALEAFTSFMLATYPSEFNIGLPVGYDEVLKVAQKILSKGRQ